MVEISILEFLASGQLGPISLGMLEADVQSVLGDPTDKGGTSRKYRRPSIWLYGKNVEVVFDPKQRSVAMILVSFWGDYELAGGESFRIASDGIRGGMSRDEFVRVLASRGLGYEQKRVDSDALTLDVGNRVSAIFGAEGTELGTFRLNKLIAS